MRYKVVVSKNPDGYTVSCPALPGCFSQGDSEPEALQNIQSAIEDYLVEGVLKPAPTVREGTSRQRRRVGQASCLSRPLR